MKYSLPPMDPSTCAGHKLGKADVVGATASRSGTVSWAESLRSAFRPHAARSEAYRNDIDGLRAVAVVLVLFFHGHIAPFRGGYIGVDIFYVISGYLIASLIVKEAERGKFSLVSFYERRMRRIFPALFSVALLCALAAVVAYSPKDLADFGRSLAAMALFVGNVFFKHESRTGYFGNASQLQPLLHTWSLSVEEQFYLLFPAVLLLLLRYARAHIRGALAVLAGLSLLVSVWATQHRPLMAFYILIPRAWELLLGSLLAVKALRPVEIRVVREIVGLLGLGLIAWGAFLFTSETTFPGVNALVPCLGACAVIYAGEKGESFTKRILGAWPIVFIGVISYSLYLWHWPILVFARYFSAGELTAPQTAAALGSSVIAAAISYVAIEAPFRKKHSWFARRQVFSFGLLASSLCLALGAGMYLSHGVPQRYGKVTEALVVQNTARKGDFEEVCGSWKGEMSQSGIGLCQIGPDSGQKIMFWGDSYAQQLYPLIKKTYDEGKLRGLGALFAIENACIVAVHLNGIGRGYSCDVFAQRAMLRAEEPDIDTVFIVFNTWWAIQPGVCAAVDGKCVKTLSIEETRRLFLEDLGEEIATLRRHGRRIVVSLPFPMFDKSIPDLEIRNAVFGRFGLAGVPKDISLPSVRDDIAEVAKKFGAETFDPRRSLCPAETCITEVNGVSIYKDDNHIAASQVGLLENNLRQVLARSQ